MSWCCLSPKKSSNNNNNNGMITRSGASQPGGRPVIHNVTPAEKYARPPRPTPTGPNAKCRNHIYPQSLNTERFYVPDAGVPWDNAEFVYHPIEYTAIPVALAPAWADPPSQAEGFQPQYNAKDGKVNRKSFVKEYKVDNNRPINPIGRTGLTGRGLLGKWGPNHAADPIVTRWKRDAEGETVIHETSGKPILQFVCIQRKDSGEWAIPGGMVDDDEEVSLTLKREFGEEALNSLETTEEQKAALEEDLKQFFESGTEIYKGYVDDPRNTDNAWMETVAVNFHDADGSSVGRFPLAAGDDAGAVQWHDVDAELKLYASHASFMETTATLLDAHWS